MCYGVEEATAVPHGRRRWGRPLAIQLLLLRSVAGGGGADTCPSAWGAGAVVTACGSGLPGAQCTSSGHSLLQATSSARRASLTAHLEDDALGSAENRKRLDGGGAGESDRGRSGREDPDDLPEAVHEGLAVHEKMDWWFSSGEFQQNRSHEHCSALADKHGVPVDALESCTCSKASPVKLNHSVTCPEMCPFTQNWTGAPCFKVCVFEDSCGDFHLARTFASRRVMECVPPCGIDSENHIPGCAVCSDVGICSQCYEGFYLIHAGRGCRLNSWYAWVTAFIILGTFLILLVWYLLMLSCRRVTNSKVYMQAMHHYWRCLPWSLDQHDKTVVRSREVFRTSFLSFSETNPGTALFFRWLIFMILFVALILIPLFLAYEADVSVESALIANSMSCADLDTALGNASGVGGASNSSALLAMHAGGPSAHGSQPPGGSVLSVARSVASAWRPKWVKKVAGHNSVSGHTAQRYREYVEEGGKSSLERERELILRVFSALWFSYLASFVLALAFVYHMQRAVNLDDNGRLTYKDFCVVVAGLPASATDKQVEEYLRDWLPARHTELPPLQEDWVTKTTSSVLGWAKGLRDPWPASADDTLPRPGARAQARDDSDESSQDSKASTHTCSRTQDEHAGMSQVIGVSVAYDYMHEVELVGTAMEHLVVEQEKRMHKLHWRSQLHCDVGQVAWNRVHRWEHDVLSPGHRPSQQGTQGPRLGRRHSVSSEQPSTQRGRRLSITSSVPLSQRSATSREDFPAFSIPLSQRSALGRNDFPTVSRTPSMSSERQGAPEGNFPFTASGRSSRRPSYASEQHGVGELNASTTSMLHYPSERPESSRRRISASRDQQCVLDPRLHCVDRVVLSLCDMLTAPTDCEKAQGMEVRRALRGLRCSGFAYAVLRTQTAVTWVLQNASTAPPFQPPGERPRQLTFSVTLSEPQDIRWEHHHRGRSWAWRLAMVSMVLVGSVVLFLLAVVTMAVTYIHVSHVPGVKVFWLSEFLLGLLPALGGTIMCKVLDWATDHVGYREQDTREYSLLFWGFIVTFITVLGDFLLTLQIAVGANLDESFDGGVMNFERVFARELYCCLVPGYVICVALLPSNLETMLQWSIARLLVRSNPVKLAAAEKWLEPIPFEQSFKYSDVLTGVSAMLCMLPFASSRSWTSMLICMLMLVYVFFDTHWKLVRCYVPSRTHSERLTVQAMQWFVVPLSILGSSAVHWGTKAKAYGAEVHTLVPLLALCYLPLVGVARRLAPQRETVWDASQQDEEYGKMAEDLSQRGDVATYFNTNPIHCLRSHHSDLDEAGTATQGCVPYMRGKEHLILKNVKTAIMPRTFVGEWLSAFNWTRKSPREEASPTNA